MSQKHDYILSIWGLDPGGEFYDTEAGWESEPVSEAAAREAMRDMTRAMCMAIIGEAAGYLISLDKLDQDGIGVSQDTKSFT